MGRTDTANRKPGAGFVSAYIQHIGSREPKSHAYGMLPPEHPRHASYLIGRSCLLLTAGDDKAADGSLRHARDHMRRHTEGRRNIFSADAAFGAHLFHIAAMLLERDSHRAPDDFRTATHKQAIEELRRIKRTMEEYPARLGELAGRRTEQQGIGLLTRYVVVDMVTQALPHHDMGADPQTNYDFLGINGDDWLAHQAQLKDACLDFEGEKEGRPKGIRARRKYRKDIVLISGHCDIHHGDAASLSDWLIDEAENNAPREVIETLDTRTISLEEALVVPEAWRMGSIPLR